MDHHRRIALYMYLIGFFDLFGVSMIIPLLSKHARSLGATPAVDGAIGSVYGALQLFSSPMVGRWSDTSGRRYVFLMCLVLSASGYSLLGVSTSLTLLLLARVPPGLFKHSAELAKAYLTDSTPADQRSEVLGRLSSVSSIGFILGPLIGGHLGGLSHGFYIVAWITSLCFIINYAIVWYFVPETEQARLMQGISQQRNHTTKVSSWTTELKSSLTAFWSVRWFELWDLFLVRFLLGFSIMVSRSNFSMMMDYKYQASSTEIGYVISYGAIIGTFSGFFVGKVAKLYQSDYRLLLHMAILQVFTLLAMSFAPSLWVLTLCLTPLSISTAISRVCCTNMTISRGSAQEVGTLLGLGASVLSVARMLSPLIGGIAQEVHLSGASLVGTFCAALGTVVLCFMPTRSHHYTEKIKVS